jgi:hypothetical protein
MADINRTLRAVFPTVAAYAAFVGSFMASTVFTWPGGKISCGPTRPRIETCLAARGITDLGWYEPQFGAVLPHLPRYLKDRLAHQGRVLTDAEPYVARVGGRRSF